MKKQTIKTSGTSGDNTQEIVQSISDHFYGKFGEIDNKFGDIDKKLDKLQNGQDRMIKILEDLQQDNAIGANQTRDLRIDVDTHEKRIKSLEAATP